MWWSYLVKRLWSTLPVLLGVNLLTFMLFFQVNSPDDVARMHLGVKHTTGDAITTWKQAHGYDLPLYYDVNEQGMDKITHTLFVQKSLRLFLLDFGSSDAGRDIAEDIRARMVPSLVIAVPTLLLGLFVDIATALLLVFFRRSYVDGLGSVFCVLGLSISSLFYIIFGQFVFAKLLKLVPISGYLDGINAIHFVILPIVIGVVGGMGSGVRWYRTIFLEEMGKDYVTTARAKGLSELQVLFKHVLRNGLIPILTGVVVVIPLLFMGSLILESFFGIPGLGSYTIDAIQAQDFAIVRCMVFLGSVFYVLGLILTDLSYTMADPRIRLQK